MATRWHTRIGLALASPRVALAIADEPAAAGRAGSDLMRLLGLLLLAAHLRRVVAAVWLALAIDVGVGARGLIAALSQAWTTPLVALAVLTAGLFVVGGATRSIGRAMDAAAVAAVPVLAVELVGTLALRHAEGALPAATSTVLTVLAAGWAVVLAALATPRLRQPATGQGEANPRGAGVVGLGVLVVALAGAATDATWIVRNRDLLRPMRTGDVVPALALPIVAADGSLGPPVPLVVPGRATVIEFWATWCGPCKQSLPILAQLRRDVAREPIDVITVNLDDAAGARRYLDAQGYGLEVRRDDGVVAPQFGVSTIPHLVIVDAAGRVAAVHRGVVPGAELRAAARAAAVP